MSLVAPLFDNSLNEFTKNKWYTGGAITSSVRVDDGSYSSHFQYSNKDLIEPLEDNVGGVYLIRNDWCDNNGYTFTIGGINYSGRITHYDETFYDGENNSAPPFILGTKNYYGTRADYSSRCADKTSLSNWESVFATNLPIFDTHDEDGINKYVKDGDISSAINYEELVLGDVYTRVYVDKSAPPNLKFTWNVENGEPPSQYTIDIRFNLGRHNLSPTTDVWGELPTIESSGSYSTTWGLLESKVPEAYRVLSLAKKIESIEITFALKDGSLPLKVTIDKNGNYNPTSEDNGKHHLRCYRGSGENDDGFVDDDYTDSVDDSNANDDNVTINTNSMLTKTYKITSAQLKALGNFLWSAGLLDNIRLVNTNPIDNIVSCKAIPISIDGTDTTVSMGNVDSGVNGKEVNSNYLKKTIGKIVVPRIYDNFVDFDYSQIYLYLPLIGVITDLVPCEVCGYELTLKYVFDVITGDCLAELFNNRGGGLNCIGTYKGNCSIDIPISASNRAQLEAGYISDFVGAISSVASKDASGVIGSGLTALTRQHVTRSSGCVNGVTSQGLPRKAYLTVVENITQIPSNYSATYGRPCNLTKKLGNLNGFTVCDKNIRLSNINCTYEEKEELRQLLTEGVIL